MGTQKPPHPTAITLAIAVAVIGCLGTIIGALIRRFPVTTQPTATPLAYTSIPTDTLAPQPSEIPRNTAGPAPTEIPISVPTNTLPGTVLEVGQIWRQGDEEVILQNAETKSYGGQAGIDGAVRFDLYLTNRGTHDINLSFNYAIDNTITARDNLGNSLQVHGDYQGLPGDPCGQETMVVAASDTVNLSCSTGFIASVDIGNLNITAIFVTINGIASISNARWRIPIYHQ